MAPFYDLISTCAYPELSKKMAMKIGKESRFKWIRERHWRQMADQLDIKFSYLKGSIVETAEILENKLGGVAEAVAKKYNGEVIIQRVCDVITNHISQVRSYL